MPAQLARLLGLSAALAAIALAGCGDGQRCGPGTVEKEGKCLLASAAPSCGAGTTQVGNQCVAVDAASETATSDAAGSDAAAEATDISVAVDATEVAATPDCVPACGPTEVCVQGICQPAPPPAAWLCGVSTYADGAVCNCGCGTPDPDCAQPAAPVKGCIGSAACNADGNCAACKPACGGVLCGDDGCGGSCGSCLDPVAPVCIAGKCSACVAQCGVKQCGGDGCGGTCGECPTDKLCSFGQCVAPPPGQSCVGHCGSVAPSGCACTSDCGAKGNCCIDVDVCGCIPACTGLSCGSDGCGGQCGACANGQICEAGACIFPSCGPATCNGHGTCDPKTVTCSCSDGYQGKYCDQCPIGQVGFPACATPCTNAQGCGDGEPCTSDDCVAGICVHLPFDATCAGSTACIKFGCVAGTCQMAKVTNCNDNNACTADSCDPVAGCSQAPSGASACEDDKPCTAGDTCAGATCKAGTVPTNCDDGNTCTVDSCDAAKGCLHVGTGAACNLGDLCSLGAVCNGASCTSVGAVDCSDAKPCTIDSCAAATGKCSSAPTSNGNGCEDGAACTQGDLCDGLGSCLAGPVVCALTVKTGLVAHYAAWSTASVQLAADASITGWQDLSGNAHHLYAIDPKKLPHLVNKGVQAGNGIGLAGSAGLATKAWAVPAKISIFAVLCVDPAASPGAIAAQGSAWALATDGTGNVDWSAGGSGGFKEKLFGGQCYVLVARGGASGRTLDVIEAMTSSQAAGGVDLSGAATGLAVGAGGGGSTLGELLVYDYALSDSERDAVAAYLRTAWQFAAPTPDLAWYDAGDANTVVKLPKSNAVAAWKDKSPWGRDASVGQDKSPTWYPSATSNGRPAVRFDGTAVRLQTDVSFLASVNMTVFAVFEMDAPQEQGTLLAQGTDKYFSLAQPKGATKAIGWQVGGASAGPTVALSPGTWQLVTAVQQESAGTIYLSPTAAQSAVQAMSSPGKELLSIGNGAGNGRSMGGFVAEVRAYASALGATDRAYVEAILRAKYGL